MANPSHHLMCFRLSWKHAHCHATTITGHCHNLCILYLHISQAFRLWEANKNHVLLWPKEAIYYSGRGKKPFLRHLKLAFHPLGYSVMVCNLYAVHFLTRVGVWGCFQMCSLLIPSLDSRNLCQNPVIGSAICIWEHAIFTLPRSCSKNTLKRPKWTSWFPELSQCLNTKP